MIYVFFVQRRCSGPLMVMATFALLVGLYLSTMGQAYAQGTQIPIKQISSDPYTNSTSQHQTQVEPDTLSFGATVVSTFQSGRFYAGGGSSGISWSTTKNSGFTWKSGVLPGITTYNNGLYGRVSDSVVAYDLAHHTWLISSLAIKTTTNITGSTDVIVSRSHDGLVWSNPVIVVASSTNNNFDKDWIVCDQTRLSKFFGRCYTEWDDSNNNGHILMSFSDDGGLTWSAPQSPVNQSFAALGGQPLVQPNGNVIVPIYGYDLTTGAEGIYSYMSTDGGQSWTDPIKIMPSTYFIQAASYRGGSLPSAEIDKDGKVYVAWAGCYFEPGCTSDDIVFTTTINGTNWKPLQRIPLNPIGSGSEHITAGLAVDKTTGGANAHLAVTYYYFPDAACTNATCQMYVGFASSKNAGTSWSQSQLLTGPMALTWYVRTSEGYMTGDYISTSIACNRAVVVVPVAQAPNSQFLNQSIYGGSLAMAGGSIPSEVLTSITAAAQLHIQNSVATKNYHTAN